MLSGNIAENCIHVPVFVCGHWCCSNYEVKWFTYLLLSIVGYSSEGNGRRMCYIMQTDAEVVETRN